MALCSSGVTLAQGAPSSPSDLFSLSSAFFHAARSVSTAAVSGSLFDCTVICDLPGPLARNPISRRPSFFHLPRQYLSFVSDVSSNAPFGNQFARPVVAAANNFESFTSTVREMFTANSPLRLWFTERIPRARSYETAIICPHQGPTFNLVKRILTIALWTRFAAPALSSAANQ